MGHRLSSIVTRTGDAGTTGLGDGSRVAKTDARVHAMGDIDELNSHLGLLVAMGVPSVSGLPREHDPRALLKAVQQDLFDLGGELSIPGYSLLKAGRVLALDQWLEGANASLPRLAEFIIPGGSLTAAQAHVCRTVCRRAERALLAIEPQTAVSDEARQYLNRLSDALFVLARLLNRTEGDPSHPNETQWQRERYPGA